MTREEDGPLAIPLDAVKKALRVDFDDDDEMITGLTRAETQRYELFTRRILAPGELVAGFRVWRQALVLEGVARAEVISVEYVDADGAVQVLPAGDWEQEDRHDDIVVKVIGPKPMLGDDDHPVRVRLRIAGGSGSAAGDGGDILDPADRAAIIHMVKSQYDHDEVLSEEDLRRRFAGRRRLA